MTLTRPYQGRQLSLVHSGCLVGASGTRQVGQWFIY
jgi:hypothetical protein